MSNHLGIAGVSEHILLQQTLPRPAHSWGNNQEPSLKGEAPWERPFPLATGLILAVNTAPGSGSAQLPVLHSAPSPPGEEQPLPSLTSIYEAPLCVTQPHGCLGNKGRQTQPLPQARPPQTGRAEPNTEPGTAPGMGGTAQSYRVDPQFPTSWPTACLVTLPGCPKGI